MNKLLAHKTKKVLSGVLILSMIVLTVIAFNSKPAKAASLTDITVTLTSEVASATGVGVVITFTPTTAITTGSIILVSYDTGFTGGASIADADVAVTGTNITSSAESGFAAGYFESVLTNSGSVTTPVTITIDTAPGLTNPVAGNYNWSVIVDIGGAGTTFDSGAGLAYVGDENDVLVTAVVAPVIDLELFQQNSSSLLADPNTCALGALSFNLVSTCVYDVGFGTNNTAGMTVEVTSDGPLDSGANTIDACTGTNCDGLGAAAVTAGQEEYGFQITNAGTGCSATAAGSFATPDQAVPASSTPFITSTATCDGTNTANITQRVEVTHKASVSGSTPVGAYDQLVTYVAFSN